ncbi:MAG TPA: hypothetical protein VNT02_11970, partial [Burkholderiales bacterium]|nr:hypothetical protein [Burkholderiales bacterium]
MSAFYRLRSAGFLFGTLRCKLSIPEAQQHRAIRHSLTLTPLMNPLLKLEALGQSIWLDNL